MTEVPFCRAPMGDERKNITGREEGENGNSIGYFWSLAWLLNPRNTV